MYEEILKGKVELLTSSGSQKSADLLFLRYRAKGRDFGDCPLLFQELERNTALNPVTSSCSKQ